MTDIIASFDYSALMIDAADKLRQCAASIRGVQRAAIADVGRHLIAAKEMLEHGAFARWAETELGMGLRSVENYMSAARFLADKNENFSLLPPSAVYALASPSTPTEVIAEVAAEIAKGTVPRVADIRERIAGITKAQRAAAAVRTAEQLKREKENEKRRRADQAAREMKEKLEREESEKRRNDKAKEAAVFLVSRLGADGIVELLQRALVGTDWHRIDRLFRSHGLVMSAQEIDEKFGSELPGRAQ